MKPTPVEFSEWRPDVATLDTKFASEVENVFAGVNSYLPFPSLLAFTDASLSNAGNDEFTKILLQFDGPTTTITDTNIGGSAHTWTAAGNATCDTGDFVFGPASLKLDGTGDWVTTPDHADFTLGTSDFTVDFWVKAAVDGTHLGIFGQCDAAASPLSTSIGAYRETTNKLAIVWATGGGPTTIYSTSDITVAAGWTHVALTRTGTSFKLYINGVQEAAAGIGGSINDSSNAFRIGALGERTTLTMNGRIEGFRLSVGTVRWADTFTPPRSAYFNAGGRACGLYSARTATGGWKVYAGTTTKLLTWSLAGWADISGSAYNVPPTEMWAFEQSGTKVVAVNINNNPQVADVDAGGNFADLAGSPPRAGHVRQMGDFLFLSRLDNSGGFNNRCVIWSGINDITHWIIGLQLCDMQEFPDGGPVQGVAGAEIGYAIQDRTIRTIQFLPGDTTFIFNFSRVLHDRGSVSKYGFTSIGNVLYFVAEDGFYSLTGQQVTPIGSDKVNEWFINPNNSDVTRRDVVHCIAGVNKPRVVWVYHASSASPMYDRQIIFDWSNGRWAKAGVSAQVWGLLASPGLDLDTTGTEFQDVLLDSAALPLDSFAYMGGRPLIGAIDPDGFLATLAGPNLPATLETAELHLMPGMRAFVNEVYPLDDAASDASGQIQNGTRETLQSGAPFWSPPVPIEPAVGSAFVMTSARLHRFRRFIPYASTWTHAQGVAVNAQRDGEGVGL
jgi:hypothetical protein